MKTIILTFLLLALTFSGCTSPGDDFTAASEPRDDVSSTDDVPGNETTDVDPTINATNETTEPIPEPVAPWTLATHGWADPEDALVYPGVIVASLYGDCTVNYVFTDPAGTTIYVGTAAHCAAPQTGETGTADCNMLPKEGLPDHELAFFGEAPAWKHQFPNRTDATGKFVYNSNLHMSSIGETNGDICYANDFALIEVDPEFRYNVSPTLPVWGGPTGIRETLAETGEHIYTFGGSLRTSTPVQPIKDITGDDDLQQIPDDAQRITRPREGIVNPWSYIHGPGGPLNDDPRSFTAYYDGGCLPGDSGSAVLDAEGKALGVHQGIIPGLGATCNMPYIDFLLEYLHDTSTMEVVMHTNDNFNPDSLQRIPI